MFGAVYIEFFTIGMFVLAGLTIKSVKKSQSFITKVFSLLGTLASLYCLIAGLFLLSGWADPFASTSAEQLVKITTEAHGRGGLLILTIKFFPYFLIIMGSVFSYSQSQIFLASIKKLG